MAPNPIYIFSPDQVLVIGLHIAGYKPQQIRRVKRDTNIDCFKDSFGVAPIVYAQLWRDLQTTSIPTACINIRQKSCTITTFLESIIQIQLYQRFDLTGLISSYRTQSESDSGRSRSRKNYQTCFLSNRAILWHFHSLLLRARLWKQSERTGEPSAWINHKNHTKLCVDIGFQLLMPRHTMAARKCKPYKAKRRRVAWLVII